MAKRWLLLLVWLTVFCSCAQAASLPDTSIWQSPDLSALTAEDPLPLRVLAIAQQEVGYALPKGRMSKYSAWFDNSGEAWCTEFVAWCAARCDLLWGTQCLDTLYPKVGTSTACVLFYLKEERYIGNNGHSFDGEAQWLIGQSEYLCPYGYLPQAGDVMWLYLNGGADYPDHTALVEGVSCDASGTIWVHVIEGNIENSVRRFAYALNDSAIVGFGTAERLAYTCVNVLSRHGGANTVRKELLLLGYDAETSRPYRMGSVNMDALHAFQLDHGLPEGDMNIATRQALDNALKELEQ